MQSPNAQQSKQAKRYFVGGAFQRVSTAVREGWVLAVTGLFFIWTLVQL